MEIFENNPITRQLHDYWKAKIEKEFNFNALTGNNNYLRLINYLDKTPQKFYRKEAYADDVPGNTQILPKHKIILRYSVGDQINPDGRILRNQ